MIDSDFDISEKDEEEIDRDDDLEPKPKKRKWIKPLVTKLKGTCQFYLHCAKPEK